MPTAKEIKDSKKIINNSKLPSKLCVITYQSAIASDAVSTVCLDKVTECARPSTVSSQDVLDSIPCLSEGHYVRFNDVREICKELDSDSGDEDGSTHGGTSQSSDVVKKLVPPNLRPERTGSKAAKVQTDARSISQAETVGEKANDKPSRRETVEADEPTKGHGQGVGRLANVDWDKRRDIHSKRFEVSHPEDSVLFVNVLRPSELKSPKTT